MLNAAVLWAQHNGTSQLKPMEIGETINAFVAAKEKASKGCAWFTYGKF